jgi:hypothetical protein
MIFLSWFTLSSVHSIGVADRSDLAAKLMLEQVVIRDSFCHRREGFP